MRRSILIAALAALHILAYAGFESVYNGDVVPHEMFQGLYPTLERLSTSYTNLKFKLRGPVDPKNKIVIVAIDDLALRRMGRWPWPRDQVGLLLEDIFKHNPRSVALDMVFSESEVSIPEDLVDALKKTPLAARLEEFDSDAKFASKIHQYREKLVLGWETSSPIQPVHDPRGLLSDKRFTALIPPEVTRFEFAKFDHPDSFDWLKSPLWSAVTMTANLERFNVAAKHAGSFNMEPAADGEVRRAFTSIFVGGRPHPSLMMETARTGTGDFLTLELDETSRVKSVGFSRAAREIPADRLGRMEINYRGPENTFPTLSAVEPLGSQNEIKESGSLNGKTVSETLNGAYVLVGVTAGAVGDFRPTPFDPLLPGVEGQANILDNILSGDPILPGSATDSKWFLVLIMAFIPFFIAQVLRRLDAVRGVLALGVISVLIFYFDTQVLFAANRDWHLVFFWIEWVVLIAVILAEQYIQQQRARRYIFDAFSRYLAPDLVELIVRDSSKLKLGGERKALSILFSDIRGFTEFSERMEAPRLSQFLNQYLGLMTNMVFESHGTLDKYIGDAVMAFWGAPVAHRDHAARACQTALRMHAWTVANNQAIFSEFGIDLKIGIGVHTGEVSVGNMGSEQNMEYTAIGDNVNLCSRLEGVTKMYGVSIITTRQTLDAVELAGQSLPAHRRLDLIRVKGKSNAVEIVELLPAPYADSFEMPFQRGRDFYSRQMWNEAEAEFAAALKTRPVDIPCRIFIERCKMFRQNPPAEGWDGAWKMDTK